MESSNNEVSDSEENRRNQGSDIVTEEDTEENILVLEENTRKNENSEASSLSGDTHTIDNTTSSASEAESSEYFPIPIKKLHASQDVIYESIELGNRVFLCQTTQLQAFIDEINSTALCHTHPSAQD